MRSSSSPPMTWVNLIGGLLVLVAICVTAVALSSRDVQRQIMHTLTASFEGPVLAPSSDPTRAVYLARLGQVTPAAIIPLLREGVWLSGRDVAVLEEDLHEAMAAYPGVPPDDLVRPLWFPVPRSAMVPPDQGQGPVVLLPNGHWVLSGAVHLPLVRPAYHDRATPMAAARFMLARALLARAKPVNETITSMAHGKLLSSVNAECTIDSECTVRAGRPAGIITTWRFPYVPGEWRPLPTTMEQVQAIPSFQSGFPTTSAPMTGLPVPGGAL